MNDPDFTPEEAAWLRKWVRRQVRDTDENETKMAAAQKRLAQHGIERRMSTPVVRRFVARERIIGPDDDGPAEKMWVVVDLLLGRISLCPELSIAQGIADQLEENPADYDRHPWRADNGLDDRKSGDPR